MDTDPSQESLSTKSRKSNRWKKPKKKKSKDYFEVITNFFLCRGCNTRFTF